MVSRLREEAAVRRARELEEQRRQELLAASPDAKAEYRLAQAALRKQRQEAFKHWYVMFKSRVRHWHTREPSRSESSARR
jgi:hypothetical protein